MEARLVEAPPTGGVRDYKMLIGGEWVEALSGKTFESINPYTGRVWATAPQAGEEDVHRAVEAARAAFDEGPWGTMTGTGRARLMRRLAEHLAENAQELATVESTDNGKLLKEMGSQLGALPSGTITSPGLRIRSRARPSPRTSPTSSSTREENPSGSSAPSCRGTRRYYC